MKSGIQESNSPNSMALELNCMLLMKSCVHATQKRMQMGYIPFNGHIYNPQS